jgi:hypothetical protein
MGDLLDVLSGGGLMPGKDRIKPLHSRPPWVTSDFLAQASKYFLAPLHNEAVQIDEIFSGIVAMAEMFVKLGSLQTVREVENYIITVGRVRFCQSYILFLNTKLIAMLLQYLAHSYDLFATLVSKTLIQCLIASQKMEWNLLYPDSVQEVDEYSIPYVNRREQGEKECVDSGLAPRGLSEEMSSPTSSSNDNPQKHRPKPQKRPLQDRPDSGVKRP